MAAVTNVDRMIAQSPHAHAQIMKYKHIHLCCTTVLFYLLIETEPRGAFKLLVEPHELTERVVLFQMDKNITFLHPCYTGKHRLITDTGVGLLCNTLIVA